MTTTTTAPARLRAWLLDLTCRALSFRIGPVETWAQVEATPSRFRVTRPGPGEMLIDFRGWSWALANHRRHSVCNSHNDR